MIQIAINGTRTNEFVPKTSESIAQSVLSAAEKGAGSVHFHPRNKEGKETLDAYFVERQITAIRAKSTIPVGISTGEWIEPNLEKRLELINAWKILPDFVSINYDEAGFDEISQLVSKKGIQIEAGLYDSVSLAHFIEQYPNGNYLRILIEPDEEQFDQAIQTITKIERAINEAKITLPILLHGFNKTSWKILELAFKKGYQTRIGFEDTLNLANGKMANTNVELLEEALRIKANCCSSK